MLTRCAVLVVLCGLGCGDKGQAGGESEPTRVATEKAPEADEGGQDSMKAEIVEIVARNKKVEVEITPPAGLERLGSKKPTWMGSLDATIPPTLVVGIDCNGSCAPDAIPGNIDKAIAATKDTARRPNINTGDPEKDAIRADLEIVRDEREGELHLLAYRISYPEGIGYPERLEVRGFLHRPGDNFFVQMQARSVLAEEERWLEPLIAAVRSVAIVSPPRASDGD